MAHVGDEVPPHLVGVLQLLGHGVEGAGQLADFIPAGQGLIDADLIMPFLHLFRRVPDLA